MTRTNAKVLGMLAIAALMAAAGCGAGATRRPMGADSSAAVDAGEGDSLAAVFDLGSAPELARDLQAGPDLQGSSGDARVERVHDAALPTDLSKDAWNGLPQPACVWNGAYQENYAPDTVAEILAGARGCYVLIDPFSSTEARSSIEAMKQHGNTVSCYISVGTCENWRDDFVHMKPYCVTQAWADWAGEFFVDRTDPALVALMKARIDKMTAWGCTMVEFDNMDWTFDDAYRAAYGFKATATEGEAYNRTLCAYVRAQGMGCMAKSSAQGASDFDGLTVESSRGNMDWWDPAHLQGMLAAGKIGLVVHYDETDCAGVRGTYQKEYGNKLSFICEDRALKKYRHFP